MILIITTVLVGIIVWYVHHKLTFWQRQGVSTPGLFYQWNYYRRELGPYDVELHKKLGPIYGTYEGLTPILILADPDLIRDVLVKEFKNFPNHKPFRLGNSIADKNMFSLDGAEDWKRIRSIVSPTFTSGNLRAMDHIVHEAIEVLKGHLGKAAKNGDQINIRQFYNSLSFDVIIRCAYGSRVDILSEPLNPILKNLENIFSGKWDMVLTMYFPKLASITGWNKRAMKPFTFFTDMTEKLLEDRKDSNRSKRNDFLQLMLNANSEIESVGENGSANKTGSSKKSISSIELMAQSFIFLLAGFDTTATIMACCVYHLSKNPDVQDKLIEEVSGISEINHDTVMDLKYLEAVLKESFRLSPPAVRVERQCVAPTLVGKIHVEPGTIVSIPAFALHRDPQQFSNPETFDPSRFLEGGADVNHHPYTFIPFGGGPRMCIAQRFALMEAKMALALVMKSYRFETAPDTKLQYYPASLDALAPMGIMVKVKAH